MSSSSIWEGSQPPFTVAQWQELEQQALIFKYLKAGVPVPSDLLAPIHKSFQLMSARLVPHTTFGYCSYNGKKIDPEPGRCRRTDGKKWRCSKDAHMDSKYCERHMNRRRYRSRKPVESHTVSQSLSTVASDIATGSRTGCVSFLNLPLHSNGSREGLSLGNNESQLQMGSLPTEINFKEYRYGQNPEIDGRSFLQESAGSAKYHGIPSPLDSTWTHVSRVTPNPLSESRSGSLMLGNSFHLRTMQDCESFNVNAVMSKQHHDFGGDLSSTGCMKQEHPVSSVTLR
ncbi:Growth-regulating factor [Quillaja saponaria]|uniref:Growth-regulating factor n=1 Tax=Quillaja saponaria TaxID=32244 RepID=A0AAD7L888_QUISA|nr:Growth-regulating factor [Quillaja saponaria]KAJ7953359.1 Growth-regulating factor [Quillaja saponaria]